LFSKINNDGNRKGKSDIANVAFLWSVWGYQESNAKKYKIRFWDTGEEMYLAQRLVQVLKDDTNEGDGKDRRDGGEGYQKKAKKVKGAKSKVNQAVNEMLESYKDGITWEEWEGIVDKIGKLFM
jgi:hypothetical protein